MKAAFIVVIMGALLVLSCSGESGGEADHLPDFNAMWDFNDPAGTEAAFGALLPEAEQSGDAGYYAELLTQIARAQGLQREFDKANATLDSAYAAIPEEKSVAMARYLLERGRVYNSSGQPDVSREYFLKAHGIAVEVGADFYAIDALHMLGIVDAPEKRMEWNLRALEMAEQSDDERARKWRGSLYNNIGWTLHDMGQYEKALDMFQRSLVFREEMNDTAGVLIAKWTIGRANRSLGKVEEALQAQLGLERDIEALGLSQDGYVYEEIAECMLLLGRQEESKKYFGLAYETLSKDEWLAAKQPDRLARLKQLSN